MKINHYCIVFILFIGIINSYSQSKSVDFIEAHATIQPNFEHKNIKGTVIYNFNVTNKKDTINIDAKKMNFEQIKLNGKVVDFIYKNNQIKLYKGFKRGNNMVEIVYNCKPRQTLYFVGSEDDFQIWTQGQGKYTSHWLPSFDDVNEKVIFNISIIHPNNLVAISNGLLHETKNFNEFQKSRFVMDKPMSSYLVMFAIGDYVKFTDKSESNTPLEFYLKPDDASKFKTTFLHSKKMFNFLENKIGIKYPWKIYRQIPVDDFLYAGMENTTTTIFSQDFVIDEIGFNDRNYLNVNAHELAHQWFGNLVTAKESKHHWLQEGFATYYAMLAEKEIFGEHHFNFELYDMAEQIIRAQDNDKEPILSAKASSLTFYKKGAWALHYLSEKIGNDKFNTAVKNYLTNYQYKNVETEDFLREINKISDFNTTLFKENWLESNVFPTKEAFEILAQNTEIQQYFKIGSYYSKSFKDKKDDFIKILNSEAYINLKEEVIYQLGKESESNLLEFFSIISNSKDVKLRQAFVRTLGKVTSNYKEFYSQFLNDDSYITQEIVLKNLWTVFPEDRISLLNKTKGWIGFNDKNLRITWLTLALNTQNYENDLKVNFYDELLNYTSNSFESNTRQNAILNLLYLNSNDTNVLKSIIDGLSHHKWQFVKFCKEVIREHLKQEKYRVFYQNIISKIDEPNSKILQNLLNEKTSS